PRGARTRSPRKSSAARPPSSSPRRPADTPNSGPSRLDGADRMEGGSDRIRGLRRTTMGRDVFEGTWEEVTARAAGLAGKRVRVTVLGDASPGTTKPLWQVAAELMSDVPDADLASLPADGASQVDHYIRGTPKRPV